VSEGKVPSLSKYLDVEPLVLDKSYTVNPEVCRYLTYYGLSTLANESAIEIKIGSPPTNEKCMVFTSEDAKISNMFTTVAKMQGQRTRDVAIYVSSASHAMLSNPNVGPRMLLVAYTRPVGAFKIYFDTTALRNLYSPIISVGGVNPNNVSKACKVDSINIVPTATVYRTARSTADVDNNLYVEGRNVRNASKFILEVKEDEHEANEHDEQLSGSQTRTLNVQIPQEINDALDGFTFNIASVEVPPIFHVENVEEAEKTFYPFRKSSIVKGSKTTSNTI